MNKIAFLTLLGLTLAGCGTDKKENTPSEAATETPAVATTNDKPVAEGAEEEEPTQTTLSPEEQRSAGIRLGKVEDRVLSGGLKVNGTLDAPPENAVTVSALLGGIVERTTLLQGSRVQAGQVLATIRNPEFLELQQNYLETSSQLEYARSEYERQEELYKQEVAPQKNYQRARAEYKALQAQVAAQAARLRLAGLPVGGKLTTSAPVKAPRGGFLKAVNVSAGQSVTATDVLFEIIDPGHLDVVLNVFEKDVPQLRTGQTVRYSLANDSVGADHQAKIYLIGRTVGEDRTVRVYAHLRHEDASRLPGTYVRAIIETNSATVPALPDKALVQFGGKSFIFVADGQAGEKQETRYRMVPVEAGVSENGYTQVTLPAGTSATTASIVTEGAYSLLAKLKNAEEEE
ncbi:efflux RND transporter periplasmic adaptor subunit [Hymenobacter lutimineralis]|uniref:Efflux RND transporter periplasmic adaptor subunit n=1 Tax=Hymenobacter lutimineralis TaxID=2606448 RepID=A0A5D6UY63_9BACT|nr:efflux RND transporter periplasmic adaptor subunit [Hymenobacter lutimineralis]TYZ07284.1 efflux RND transporter periplasmic adaptor subunit [Hymenobacter lutimineralis]